ncbi:ThiF family adenylyltransferase [Piscinibacter sakaiensis]|uniref:tRNA threonylcarbamoyladenosine dehydratase n=1 Tax=Piscinibacter sakaiensis TaxID=1547922 RepID=UPI003AAA67AF
MNDPAAHGVTPLADADLERRFGGLQRLYGEAGYRRVRTARIAVVGLGGVGSWAVEALARSGVARLVLIDLDHVAESNINRQVQALGATLGMAKAGALQQRIVDIHPGCDVVGIEEFVEPGNWPGLLADTPVDLVIDACDQLRAKAAIAAWSLAGGSPVITVGAAGGKQLPQAVEVADLADVSHDPLLASLRQRLRQHHGAPRGAAAPGRRSAARIGLRCVFSREPVRLPEACDIGTLDASASAAEVGNAAEVIDGSLNCHGYGSAVAVTASFGLVAANEALLMLIGRAVK